MIDTKKYLYGFHAVSAALRSERATVHELWCVEDRRDARMLGLLQLASACQVPLTLVGRGFLDDRVGDVAHQGVMARVSMAALPSHLEDVLEDLATQHTAPLLLVLDGVQDPHNLGACLRVADAMGVHAVIAPKDRAAGLSATAAKVASGAAESVPYIVVTNLARTLRQIRDAGVWIVGTAGEAEASVFSLDVSGPMAWVLGGEGDGLRRLTAEHCDQLARIPMLGLVESLNVSVAAGIVLAQTCRQRQEKAGST